MRCLIALLPVLLLCGAPAEAAMDESRSDRPICVEGFRFRPSADDTRAIATVPVPQAFRKPFEDTQGCGGQDETELLAWHVRFGSATSATAALVFLEEHYRSRLGKPSRYPDQVRTAYKAALPDLTRIQEADRTGRRALILGSAAVKDLDRTVGNWETMAFLAEQYLRAAEEFHDRRLLDRSEEYAQPLADAFAFLEPREHTQPVDGLVFFNIAPWQVDDMLQRIAVLKAEISHQDGDIERAAEALASTEPKDAEKAIKVAYSGGTDFCDISAGWSRTEQVTEACKEHADDYPFRVTSYAANKARLDLLNSDDSRIFGSLEGAIRLLSVHDDSFCCLRSAEDRLFQLQTSAAAHFFQAAEHGDDDGSLTQALEALEALEAAERLAPPYEAPARFRRVAQRWLEAWSELANSLSDQPERSLEADYPEKFRYAAYLRSTLANLDKIALGEPVR